MRRLIFLALLLAAAGCGGCEEKAAPAAATTAAAATATAVPAAAAVPAPSPAQAPATPTSELTVIGRTQSSGAATAGPVLADSEKKEGQPVPAPAPRELNRRLGPGLKFKKMPNRLMLNSRMLKQQQSTSEAQSVPATAPAGQ